MTYSSTIEKVLEKYKLNSPGIQIKPLGNGLINRTWYVADEKNEWVLQRINDTIFKQPENISHNIHLIVQYLSTHHPDYFFIKPIPSVNGEEMVYLEAEGYFRLYPFVPGSHTLDVVQSPDQAFEAAKQFGQFTKLLSGINQQQLKITLPDFHNLSLRYNQFTQAVKNGNKKRITQAGKLINQLQQLSPIVTTYEDLIQNHAFKKRVTHHDTKISNVLFNDSEKGMAVIDLDTVMPGIFLSDVGDMLRTYLSPVSEEEKDMSAIEIRDEYFYAIREGYLSEMSEELTITEKEHFVYAGKFMIYMQALRFLTDYLNNDSYYSIQYENHNLIRAHNQLTLLLRLIEKERSFNMH